MAGKKFAELAALTAEITPQAPDETATSKPKTAPGQMMALSTQRDEALDQRDEALERAKKAEAMIAMLEKQLREKQDLKGYLEIPLEKFHKVPGRQRQLTAEERAELKENLRQHPLANPITFQLRSDGEYDIVSGNNRHDIYVELHKEFGDKPMIKACLEDAPAEVIEELAFYANLLHPSLPAFEKFIGLKNVMYKDPANPLTHQQLADRTGITRTTVTDLLQFDALPQEAIKLLSSNTSALGSKAAAKLASLSSRGRNKQVVEAVRKLVSEGITEAEAVKFAAEGKLEKTSNTPPLVYIRSGRKSYCTMLSTKKILRLDFQSEEDRLEVETQIKELLEKQAARRKQGEE